jgi:ABC-type multidrug transport system ATPase subunit
MATTTRAISLRDLTSFGDVAAEDDAVLEYFLTTDAVTRIKNGEVLLVLGRKGAGKTALVRRG